MSRPGPPSPVTAATVYRAVLLALVLVGVVLIFSDLVYLLLMLLLAAVIAVPLSAAADRLQRRHVPRGISVPLTFVVALVVIGGIIAALVPTFIHEGQHFIDELPSLLTSLNHTFHDIGGGKNNTNIGSSAKDWINGYIDKPQRLLGPATTVASTVGGIVTAVLVVVFTALFSAIFPDSLRAGIVRLAPPRHRPTARLILHRLGTAYLAWLVGLLASMAVLGVVTYVGLTLIGLPFALVFAVLTAMATVVPYYGALLSYIPPLIVGLTISVPKGLLVILISLIAHFIEGNLVSPLIMARAVRLHPALVAAGVVAVERLVGFAGLIVAVPVIVTVKILVEETWIRGIETGEDAATGEAVRPGEAVDVVAADAPPAHPPRLVLPRRLRRRDKDDSD